jgi:hypothetical protein
MEYKVRSQEKECSKTAANPTAKMMRLARDRALAAAGSTTGLAEQYKRNPMTWLFGNEDAPAQVFTQDEHDPSIAAKPFPDKAYIRQIVSDWMTHKMCCWEKSRQIMASWTFCALYLHDTQFGTNRLNFIQSKKEEDSDALLKRCYFIYEHQEAWLKALYPAVYTYCHLDFYARDDKQKKLALNRLWAIPQGGHVLRQHTASGLLIDEAAFQPDLAASIRAAQPMLNGGGRIDCVSSAEPGYFEQLCSGKVK